MSTVSEPANYGEFHELYVVKPAKPEVNPAREPTLEEQLLGWRLTTARDKGKKIQVLAREGRGAGCLHELRADYILTWKPKPGDMIVASFRVWFTGTARIVKDKLETFVQTNLTRASVTPEAYTPFDDPVGLRITTVLGRPVMLGEDLAEDAFGHDAIEIQLEKALKGDWRDMPVDVEFYDPVDLPEDQQPKQIVVQKGDEEER